MKNQQTICYYISGHGYGHAARASQVIGALPAEVKILCCTQVPAEFIRRESGRDDVAVKAGRFDSGVVQSDNREVDWDATVEEALKCNAEVSRGMMAEVDYLRKNKVDLVVTDVGAAPLEIARMAGVPSVVVGNFTWVEILEKTARDNEDAADLVELWKEQYAMATLAIRTEPAFPMKYFRHSTAVELVARSGQKVAKLLRQTYNIPAKNKLVLLYFGIFGDDELVVPDLPGVSFLSFTPVPGAVHQVDTAAFSFPDVVASADCVIAKPGYGTIGECMANGTSVVYYPRNDFAEYPLLRKAIESWGGGSRITPRELLAGKWAAALEKAMALKPVKVKNRGAQQTAAHLLELIAE